MTQREALTMEFLHKTLLSEESCKRTSKEQMLYRYDHSMRVAAIGKRIAQNEGMNVEALTIACMLHDIGYSEYSSEIDWKMHGHISADVARDFLRTLDFDSADYDAILIGIATHVIVDESYSGSTTPFTESVGDSDNIDRFDVFRVYDTLHAENFRDMLKADQLTTIKSRLERLTKYKDAKFATATATELWRDVIEYQLDFYSRLQRQLSSGIV